MSFRFFETESRSDWTIVKLHDTRMFKEFADLHGELESLLGQQQTEEFVIDFAAISYCPSVVVSALLRLQKNLGKAVKLCDMNQTVRDTFRALGLDKTLFKIFATVDDAIGSIQD